MSTKYGKKVQEEVGQALHEEKHQELKSGKSGKTVTLRKQAIAIGLAKAREAGAKVPSKRKRTRHYAALRGTTRHYAALRGITRHYAALRGINTPLQVWRREGAA